MPKWLLALLAGAALCACSTTNVGCAAPPKPAPAVPAGQVSCDQGCTNATALSCGLSAALCRRICNGIAAHNPAYPTCLYNAKTCADESACGGDDGDGSSANGPGSGRSGP